MMGDENTQGEAEVPIIDDELHQSDEFSREIIEEKNSEDIAEKNSEGVDEENSEDEKNSEDVDENYSEDEKNSVDEKLSTEDVQFSGREVVHRRDTQHGKSPPADVEELSDGESEESEESLDDQVVDNNSRETDMNMSTVEHAKGVGPGDSEKKGDEQVVFGCGETTKPVEVKFWEI